MKMNEVGKRCTKITPVIDNVKKQNITQYVLEALPDWFGIPEAREEYIKDSTDKIYFCACNEENNPVGFLYLKETGKATVELAVMGVLKEYNRMGIGRELFCHARKAAYEQGYSFIQVKTVQMGKYEDYDQTNMFYISLGFQEFECIPTLWDEENPCQIYVMALD